MIGAARAGDIELHFAIVAHEPPKCLDQPLAQIVVISISRTLGRSNKTRHEQRDSCQLVGLVPQGQGRESLSGEGLCALALRVEQLAQRDDRTRARNCRLVRRVALGECPEGTRSLGFDDEVGASSFE